MRRLSSLLLVVTMLLIATSATAETGIVYPVPNQPVTPLDGRLRVDLRGDPYDVWTVSVNDEKLERAALDDSGRLTLFLPAPNTEEILIVATNGEGTSAVVVWHSSTLPAPEGELPQPPEVAPGPLMAPAILAPETGARLGPQTSVVVSGPPGSYAALRAGDEAIATFRFDDTGLAELTVASYWTSDLYLSLDVGDVRVYRRVEVENEPPRALVQAVESRPDPATGRALRLTFFSLLSITAYGLSYGPVFTNANDGLGEEVQWAALASVFAIPVAGIVPYLFTDVDMALAIPFAIAIAGGVASWGAARLLAEVDHPDARLAYMAPPLAAFVFAFSAYEGAHARAQVDAWQVVAGPGDAGLSLRRTW